MAETEESAPQWFLRFQETNDRRLSRLEAMAADFLCRSRKEEKENPEDPICDDEELVETEVETKSSGSEDRAVENEANTKTISAMVKEESIPQFQVPISKLEPSLRFHKASPDVCEDFKPLVSFDGLFDHVKARNELVTKSTSVTNNQVTHQLFDEIPLRKGILPKEHKKRFHKCWRFKFKEATQPRGLIQEKLCVHEANETMNQLMLLMHLGRYILHQQLEIILCEYKNQILQLSSHHLETQLLPCLQRFSVVRMGIHVVFGLQEIKPIWWFGYNEAVEATSIKQALSYWSVASHVIRDAQESFGSKGLAYDGCVVLETNFAGFGRGKTELLATSQKMQKMDLFSFGIHTTMEEDLKQQGNGEPLVIVPDVGAKVDLVWEGNSLVFHFKTRVWDPGRALIEDVTPREFPFHSTATISFSLLFFLSRITCKFSSLQTLRTRFL